MDIHYNAFISYRHHPDDIRAATQIHRALERFRVPKALRKDRKLPLRLFRDKDELPITSNLSDDIFSALRNSDFLIVICSVHTKESLWVQREIETFLQTHSRHQVLTVLISGEPYDVIPEILLYEETVDPATGETRRIPMEPLSCDWRMGHRKAMREELPRLAAALLHCGYDELRQRQRQYRTKQLIAAFSIALTFSLGLAAYFLYTSITIRNANIQIQENLDQALRNQSRHLSTAAQELLGEGDRLTAIALLLEALPSEENQRPYVADAEYVLAEALGVYSQENTMAALGALIPNASAEVFDFALTDNTDVIYLRDSRSIVTSWDTETLLKMGTIVPPELAELLGTTAGSNVLVQGKDGQTVLLQCYDPQGTLLWQKEDFSAMALSWDAAKVYVLTYDWEEGTHLNILDAETGADLRPPLPLPETPEGEYALQFCHEYISEGFPIPMVYADWGYRTCLVDPDTGAVTPLFYSDMVPSCSRVLEDGKVLFMVSDGSGMWNGTMGSMRTSSPARSDIFCYDLYSGALLWQSEINTCQYTSEQILYPVPESDLIFCQTGNTVQLIQAQDGSLVQSCDTVSSIVKMLSVNADYAMGFLDDGAMFSYRYASNECTAVDYNMEGGLKEAVTGGNAYTLPFNSTQVTVYNFQEVPTAWTYDLGTSFSASEMRRNGSRLAFTTLESSICLFDLQTRQPLWEIPRETMSLLDFSQDGALLWALEGYDTLVAIDTQTGSTTHYTVPTTIDGNTAAQITKPQFAGGQFWYLLSYGQTLRLCSYRPETDSAEYYEALRGTTEEVSPKLAMFANSIFALDTFLTASKDSLTEEELRQAYSLMETLPNYLLLSEEAQLLTVRNGFAWVMAGTGDLYELDLAENTSTLRLSGLTALPAFAFRESDGAVAVTLENEILLFAPGAEELQRIPTEEERPGSLYFYGEELLVLTDTGYLLRFGSDGSQLSRTGLSVSDSYSGNLFEAHAPLDITWQAAPDGRLVANVFQVGNIIDPDSWTVCAYVPQCCIYDETADQFLVYGQSGPIAYPHYKTQELITLAQEALGSYTLSQEQREAYGIG